MAKRVHDAHYNYAFLCWCCGGPCIRPACQAEHKALSVALSYGFLHSATGDVAARPADHCRVPAGPGKASRVRTGGETALPHILVPCTSTVLTHCYAPPSFLQPTSTEKKGGRNAPFTSLLSPPPPPPHNYVPNCTHMFAVL